MIKEKYIEGCTISQIMRDAKIQKATLLTRLPALLRKVLLCHAKRQDSFTHYDLSVSNILVSSDKDEIHLLDFEYAFSSRVRSCSKDQAFQTSFHSVVQGTVTPMMCDPYVDTIVLMTNFFEDWKRSNPKHKAHFLTLEHKCINYFKAVGFHVTGDPRFWEKSHYLVASQEYERIIGTPVFRKLERSCNPIPVFSVDGLQPISFEELLKELENPCWDTKGRRFTFDESGGLWRFLLSALQKTQSHEDHGISTRSSATQCSALLTIHCVIIGQRFQRHNQAVKRAAASSRFRRLQPTSQSHNSPDWGL